MKYTLYLRTASGDHFLQKALEISDLQKSHATVYRWINQMNLSVSNPNTALLVIAETDSALLIARYIAGGRRVWRDPVDDKERFIRCHSTANLVCKSP